MPNTWVKKDNFKTSREHKRRLNSNICNVVKKEVMKFLDVKIIYPISDIKWVSLTHVVLKKEDMTVV